MRRRRKNMEIKVIGTNSSNRIKLIKNIKKATDNNIDIKLVEKDNRYNITKTALELKLSRQTLYNKLKKYGLI